MKLKKKHIVTIFVSLFAIAALMAAPTYSYLISKSETVTNTFEGGTFDVSIDEGEVDEYGTFTDSGETRTSEGQDYTYFAGAELDKDPTVTVTAGSEKCYVYVCVVDGLTSSEYFSIKDLRSDYWTAVATATDSDGNTVTLYRYYQIVDQSDATADLSLEPIFTKIKVSEELTAEAVTELNAANPTITVTALAVQAAELTESGADDVAMAAFTDSATDSAYSWTVVATDDEEDEETA